MSAQAAKACVFVFQHVFSLIAGSSVTSSVVQIGCVLYIVCLGPARHVCHAQAARCMPLEAVMPCAQPAMSATAVDQ